eukprot:m.61896 g.61896  ORF g.61896 m.61896 type:complete len:826 (+) comp7372_c0_seq1:1-2478(+)
MSSARAVPLFVAGGCNDHSGVLDWADGTVAFGAADAAILVECNAGAADEGRAPFGNRRVLASGAGRITALRWAANGAALLAGTDQGTLLVHWPGKGTFEALPHSHAAGQVVCSLAVAPLADAAGGSAFLAASAGADALVIITRVSQDGADVLVQELNSARLPLSVALARLNSGHVFLAIGRDTGRIELHVADTPEKEFVLAVELEGHTDWVTSLSFSPLGGETDAVLLASASQDETIRVWHVGASAPHSTSRFEAALKMTKRTFSAGERSFAAELETVLSSHEAKVYSVCWHPSEKQCLLSASIDRTVIVWKPDAESGLWVEEARLGEIGGLTPGFFGAVWGSQGRYIAANGYQGSIHVWRATRPDATASLDTAPSWQPLPPFGGHFRGVMDLAWETDGHFLLTTGLDQTTRVFAQWNADGDGDALLPSWHEIARAQVHGYDMKCLAYIGKGVFASGADEKVIRVFEAPKTFLDTLFELSRVKLAGVDAEQRAVGASVPALGLSNSAVAGARASDHAANSAQEELQAKMQEADDYGVVLPGAPAVFAEPPQEESLLQNTLWPETQKLYGHGYELLSMAASHDGAFLATASKSTSPEHASIRIWSTSSWTEVQQLDAHKLSVTQLAFSQDDRFLLSCSRDRQWAVFERAQTGASEVPFVLLKVQPKAHDRIIWAVDWLLSTSEHALFATGSRDKTVKIWERGVGANTGKDEPAATDWHLQTTLPASGAFAESVTALASCPTLPSSPRSGIVLAVGLESGRISLLFYQLGDSWQTLLTLDAGVCHNGAVRRLAWRPHTNDDAEHRPHGLELASCSLDWTVRITRIDL